MQKYIRTIQSVMNKDSYSYFKMQGAFIDALLDEKLTNKEKDEIQKVYVEKAQQIRGTK